MVSKTDCNFEIIPAMKQDHTLPTIFRQIIKSITETNNAIIATMYSCDLRIIEVIYLPILLNRYTVYESKNRLSESESYIKHSDNKTGSAPCSIASKVKRIKSFLTDSSRFKCQ